MRKLQIRKLPPIFFIALLAPLALLAQDAQPEAEVPQTPEGTLAPEDTFEAIGFMLGVASGLNELEFTEAEQAAIVSSFESCLSGDSPSQEVAAEAAEARQFLMQRYQTLQGEGEEGAEAELQEASESMLAATGRILCDQSGLKVFEPTDEQQTKIIAGLKQGMGTTEPPENMAEAQREISNYFQTRGQEIMERDGKRNLAEGQAWLEEKGQEEGVQKDESGFYYKVLEPGSEPKADMDDQVQVHYTGTLIDGTVFDSSRERGQPATFPMNGVVPGFSGGLSKIGEGGHVMIYIPASLGYGERGAGSIPPNSTLIFDVELLDINPGQPDQPQG